MLAQSLGEYGFLTGALTGLGDAAYYASVWVGRQSPATWIVLGAGALVVLRYLLRRRGV